MYQAVKSLVMMFPQKQIDAGVMYECLKDLSDEQFDRGFKKMLNETERIDASTNVIAIIREKSKGRLGVPDTRPAWMIEAMKIGPKAKQLEKKEAV